MGSHKNHGASKRRFVYGVRNACGKVAYPDRKRARHAARWKPNEQLRAYRCEDGCGLWHLGHNPGPVRRGEVSADEYYRRGRYAPDDNEIEESA